MSNKTSWSLLDRDGEKLGHYMGVGPAQVAKKMIKQLHKDQPNKRDFKFRFVRNDYGRSPIYSYHGIVDRIQPITKRFPNGKTITVNYKYKVQRLLE